MARSTWPHEHDGIETLAEQYGYPSSLHIADDGSEQRRSLAVHPAGGAEYLFTLDTAADATLAQALLYPCAGQEWIVPLWQYAQPLAVAAGPGDMEIQARTGNVPFLDPLGLGRWVALYSRPGTVEIAELTDASGDVVTLLAGIAGSFPLGNSWAVPCRRGVATSIGPLTWLTPSAMRGRIQFEFVTHEDGDSQPSLAVFGGLPGPMDPSSAP